MKTSFYQYTYHDLLGLFVSHGLHLSGANRLYNWHYKRKKKQKCVQSMAKPTLKFLEENLSFDLPIIERMQTCEDKTVKFLLTLQDQQQIETVLIPFQNKYTICLSSQVGCAMKCSFCFTGTQGLKRNLRTEEIVGQVLVAAHWLAEHRPKENRILNIVFMGQGEPLHNFDAVKNACEIFLANNGLCFAKAKITISTAGYLPGLIRWKEEMPDVNIALSLHSPFTEKRNELIPLNVKYPVSTILELVDSIPHGKNRFVLYEYLLIKDFNDTELDAHTTGKLLQGKNAYINLIPFNPIPGSKYVRPSDEAVQDFKTILDIYNIPTTIRTTKGDAILAACGQLNSAVSK